LLEKEGKKKKGGGNIIRRGAEEREGKKKKRVGRERGLSVPLSAPGGRGGKKKKRKEGMRLPTKGGEEGITKPQEKKKKSV